MSQELQLYPLTFAPILKDKLWGGNKLARVLHKQASPECGESWEVSGIPGSESVVANGHLKGKSLVELVADLREDLVGSAVYSRFGGRFPLLIKFIDANRDLSIQVHPNDAQSSGHGKTEMWYILDADEGAILYSGFNKPISVEQLEEASAKGTFPDTMNKVPVKAGDAFFIEANHVHSIGSGILLAEVQQPSDITYRVDDFNRRDEQGNRRELHLEQAFEVMNISLQTGQVIPDADSLLVHSQYFIVKKITSTQPIQVSASEQSFKVLMGVAGSGEIRFGAMEIPFGIGLTVLIPAGLTVDINPANQLEFLEVWVGYP
jgi:mannose-6-phosphate isomerase